MHVCDCDRAHSRGVEAELPGAGDRESTYETKATGTSARETSGAQPLVGPGRHKGVAGDREEMCRMMQQALSSRQQGFLPCEQPGMQAAEIVGTFVGIWL